jgi:hypothetical protein
MSIRKSGRIGVFSEPGNLLPPLLLLCLLLFVPGLFAQASGGEGSQSGKEPKEELDKKNSGNYLEKQQFRNISMVFKEKLLLDIRALNTMSTNFPDAVPNAKSELEKIRQDYQTAVRYHYRRAYMVSGKSFLDIYKRVTELYKNLALAYEKRSDEILVLGIDTITRIEEEEILKQNKNPRESKARLLEDVKIKLRLAYFQIARADEMIRDKRYSDSIVHFRLAKDFGIRILVDLESDEAKKSELLKTYEKDLIDNRNLVFESAK